MWYTSKDECLETNRSGRVIEVALTDTDFPRVPRERIRAPPLQSFRWPDSGPLFGKLMETGLPLLLTGRHRDMFRSVRA